MAMAVRYRNGKREVVQATPDDLPVDHSEALAMRRAEMWLDTTDFVDRVVAKGWLSDADADAWTIRNVLPVWAETAITLSSDGITPRPAPEQSAIRRRIAKASRISRVHPIIALMQGALEAQGTPITDEEIDAVFTE